MKTLIKLIAIMLLTATFAASCGKDNPAPATKTVAVTGISLNKNILALESGSSETLTASITPENATDKSITWSSSNAAVAAIDATGKVTAITTGSATITATTTDGNKTATCTLTVTEPAPQYNIELTLTPDNGYVKIYAIAQKLTVDWGDGNVSGYTNVTEISHTYTDNNPYTVKIIEEGLTEFGDLNPAGYWYGTSTFLTVFIEQININNCHNLEILGINENSLTSIEISNCYALRQLYCFDNQLTALNVSGCTALEYLVCNNNQLTELDVSGCTALRELNCERNQLTTLNISGYTVLEYLFCYENQLTTLDVSGCTALEGLRCENNQLPTLNVSGCTALWYLDCGGNQLPTLNVSGGTALYWLQCENNQLTTLNVSGCTALVNLYCFSNQLEYEAINTVFTDLPDRTNSFGIIYIGNNSGSATCTLSIAQNKNWIVDDNSYWAGTSPMKSKMQMPERNKKLRIKN